MLTLSRQPSGEPEIFCSVQGEGVTAGTPSAFLRLAICNLSCVWCDTKYTWDWDRYDRRTEVMSMAVDEVAERVIAFQVPHLVITGGEPMLQQAELAPLAEYLSSLGYFNEVETNGTISPSPEMLASVSQWNVSPKTASSGNDQTRREISRALDSFRQLDNAFFKFVVVNPPDVEEVRELVDRFRLPAERVLLMPEGITANAVQKRGQWLAESCVRHGFRFSTRLHILLWGDVRAR